MDLSIEPSAIVIFGASGDLTRRKLVPALHTLGTRLRQLLEESREIVPRLKGQRQLLEDNSVIRQSIEVRNPYIDPLHYLQAELLRRDRQDPSEVVEQALMVTMTGIAAGMRNTG